MPNKAVAAASGSGLAGAIVTMIVILWWKDAPPDGVAALTTLVAAGVSFVTTYLTPHNG